MPDEFFPTLPRGPVRLSKGYLGRMSRAVEQSSRGPNPPTYPGNAGVDIAGPWTDVQFDEWLFAEITAQPGSGDSFAGYSWRQKLPGPTGSFVESTTPLSGDNGTEGGVPSVAIADGSITSNVATVTTVTPHGFSVGQQVTVQDTLTALDGTWLITAVPDDNTFQFSIFHADYAPGGIDPTAPTAIVLARPRFMPAFDMADPDGESLIDVGTMVTLARGYLDTASEGYDYEWLILGAAGATRAARVRVTGRPFNVDGTRYYPAVLDLNDATGVGYHDGPDPLWVVQRHGQYLDTRGLSTYTARRKLASFNVPDCDGNDDERPLYDTREHIAVVRVDFDPVCQAYYDGVFEGDAICDFLTMEGDFVTMEGDMIGV